jgi:hypothetical protein
VRHHAPHYAALDLEWFGSLPQPQPASRDLKILAIAIEKMSRLDVTARPGDLERSLRGLLPSNSSERRTVIDILGLAGVIIRISSLPRTPTAFQQERLALSRSMVDWLGRDKL